MDGATKIDHFIERKNKEGPKEVSGVPLVIYETWHTDIIPNKMKECIKNLINMNPEFDYYLYTKEQCAKFIEDNFDKEVIDAYNSLKPAAYKSDLWRYCVLYKKGGVYLDTKLTSNIPLINIIKDNPTIFVRDIDNSCSHIDGTYGLYNAFLVSHANNIVFKHCIDEIVKNCKNKDYKENTIDITGPCLLRRNFIREYPKYKINFLLKPRYVDTVDGVLDIHEIYYKDKCILQMYPEYREEQKKFHDGTHVHHGKAYKNKNVYSLQNGGEYVIPKNLAILYVGRIKGYTENEQNLLDFKKKNNGTVFCSLNKKNKSDYIKTFCDKFNIKDEQLNLEITPPTPEYMKKYPMVFGFQSLHNVYSWYYHLKKSFEMLKKYEDRHNIKFDYILFDRVDIINLEDYKFLNLENNTIYIPAHTDDTIKQLENEILLNKKVRNEGFEQIFGVNKNADITERFGLDATSAYGTFDVMKKYCNMIDYIEDIYNERGITYHPELLVKKAIDKNNIIIKQFPIKRKGLETRKQHLPAYNNIE